MFGRLESEPFVQAPRAGIGLNDVETDAGDAMLSAVVLECRKHPSADTSAPGVLPDDDPVHQQLPRLRLTIQQGEDGNGAQGP